MSLIDHIILMSLLFIFFGPVLFIMIKFWFEQLEWSNEDE
jgi:hypothetical protein